MKVLGPLTYKLDLPLTWRIHSVFHATLLLRHKENEVHGKNPLPPISKLVEGKEEYKVEALIMHKKGRYGHKYLIKWKGFPASGNTWETKKNLTHAKEMLAKYKCLPKITT